MQVDSIPIQFDKSHLSTIGERMYTQSLDLIRELVANAYDADASEVKITINESNIIVEDDGNGMNRAGLRQYFTIGSSFKKKNPVSGKFKRTRIGEFGIGKFAVLSVCDRFEIYTTSKKYSATLIFDRNDFESRTDWNIPLVEHKSFNKLASGTRVSLFDIKKSILISDVERHLINIFPLTDKNFAIFVNGNKLQPHYIPGQRFKIEEETSYGLIKGEIIIASLLLNKDLIGIGIRVKGVLIKRETFNIEADHSLSIKRLTGEINASFLPITSSREDFIADRKEYQEFNKVMIKKLRTVIRSLEKSAASYQDKKAEKVLSEALINVREAIKKNFDILLLEGLPLFAKEGRDFEEQEKMKSDVISTALSSTKKSGKSDDNSDSVFDPKDQLDQALKSMQPKMRSKIKTLLRDKSRIVKKVKIGGNEFLVSFAHLGDEEKESFTEGGVIFLNRDHQLFHNIEKNSELVKYHLIRLVSQEIIKLSSPKDLEVAFDWQGKLIKDAYLG